MIKAIYICIVALSLVACQTTQATNHGENSQLKIRDAAWISALITKPANDANRACLDSSLKTEFALLAFKDGDFDDKYVESALLNDLPNKKVHALRKADFSEWAKTHEPAMVAANHLNLCLANTGNALPVSDVWLRCFLSAEPAAMLLVYKRSARPLSAAVQAVIPYYPMSVNASEIATLAQQIYALPNDADDLHLREQIVVGCLAQK